MRAYSTAIVTTLLAGLAQATTPGVVLWDIHKEKKPQDLSRFRKRASTYEEIISNEQMRGGYFATCRLGTPAQNLTLQLDTGSSDIWVPDSGAKACSNTQTGGCSLGSCMTAQSSIPFPARTPAH